jgi:hypothetical protein
MKTVDAASTVFQLQSITTIHDSFGVLPADMEDLQKAIRTEFYSIYKSANWLQLLNAWFLQALTAHRTEATK